MIINSQIETTIEKIMELDAFWELMTKDNSIQAGPFDGGCLVCAQALCNTFNGTLVYISKNKLPIHYGAIINGQIFDFDGKHPSATSWINTFCRNENIKPHGIAVSYSPYPNQNPIPTDDKLLMKLTRLFIEQYTREPKNYVYGVRHSSQTQRCSMNAANQ